MSRVLQAVSERANTQGGNIALSGRDFTASYRELDHAIAGAAAEIERLCPGARPIALCADNSPAWVILDLAMVRLRRILVPLPKFFTAQQRAHALEETGCAFLISDERRDPATQAKLTLPGSEHYAEALDFKPASLPAGTAKVTYTSGTTGRPKGVCLSQSGMEQLCLSLVDAIGADYAGTHCAVLPLGVLLENIAGLYTTLLAGGRYHVLPQAEIGFGKTFVPDFAALAAALAQSQAKTTILVPELLRGLLRVLAVQKKSLPSMRLVAVGGARVAPALLDAAAALGLPVYQGYGLSEAASVVTLNTPRANKPGSVGRVLAHVPLSLAQDGEVLLKGPAFLGYAGGEAAPAVYATGDIARLDAEGYLFVEGRKSNVLITSFGRNVAPEWVESELAAQPQIGQALVFGDAAPALGALIVPSAMTVRDEEIAAAIGRANAALPEYAHVKHWTKVFPFTPANGLLTGNGRLRRSAIHESYRELMARCLQAEGPYISFFEQLVRETTDERNFLLTTPQICDGLEGRISLETYRLYLAQAYHHVKHTVPLLKRVRDRLPAGREWLAGALDEYIAEESGHEEWILDDIRNAGGDAEAVRFSEPAPATEFMVAYAYDYIDRINPVGFFGMVFVLEGTSTELATRGAQALMRTLRLPPSCFRYLTSHGALDIGHMQFFQRLMNRIDNEDDKQAIIHMAKRMFALFSNVFRSIPHERSVQDAA